MRQCGLALSILAKLYGIKLCIWKALEGLGLVDTCVTHEKQDWGKGGGEKG